MLSVLLAVLAAVANGLASVLQRREARTRPASESLNWRLVWHLLHRPVWLGGVTAVTFGFLLQAEALANGKLSVVESLLVLDLPATLLLSSLLLHSRMRWREWGAVAAMAGGLAGLLLGLSPSADSGARASGPTWALALGVNALLIAAGVWWALSADGTRRAAILGVATGCGFGLTAGLIKGATANASAGIGSVFAAWQLYAMLAVGAGSMFLLQSAVHAGSLLAVQPGLSLGDPVVSVLWGTLVFGEKVRSGLPLVLAAASASVVCAAVLVLTRSPLLTDDAEGAEETDRADDAEGAEESDRAEHVEQPRQEARSPRQAGRPLD